MSDDASGNRPTIFIAGFSHLGALMRAQEIRRGRGAAGFDVEWMTIFPSERYHPWVRVEDGRLVYHPAFIADMTRVAQEKSPACVFLSVWGNQHFFLSCAQSIRSFDVVLPWNTGIGRIPQAEVVPYDLLERLVRQALELPDGLVKHARDIVSCPVYTLAAPPPVGPVTEIPAGTSSRELDELVARHGVAHPLLRWKFWSICSRLASQSADLLGARLIPPPPQTFDAQGYRNRDFWGNDWLHGNIAYGEAVLRQVDQILEGAQP